MSNRNTKQNQYSMLFYILLVVLNNIITFNVVIHNYYFLQNILLKYHPQVTTHRATAYFNILTDTFKTSITNLNRNNQFIPTSFTIIIIINLPLLFFWKPLYLDILKSLLYTTGDSNSWSDDSKKN